ncbi:hypothetical protein PGT21_018404 [Puccinia graminis f. sp. tritici]|uniref:Uncharacterized protein n=2 Tax=Puccinia graminis f. sp. tritici TaxID=56615 RepID=E3KUZ7_PUCGT|nr:uncharacterized protein PGTG_12544 [Puccinia graminis f. sp. tritici CRL 75-36-700-3]EFP88097.1 hypothetical protein PGTG_12544 [Puccinia graminis f. sp. tritici CRL 75-36-700-3]KAA1064882.1 hypothetical protein PGT21_018404 [Puccinia graminis f. sp. tritici]KAA1068337.1 hypothetical protein PGTUg99_034517 [Puccinia graminis f. sp. tritici]
MSSRTSSRSSPSRIRKKPAALLPAQIPLPPSPPTSDALVLDDHLASSSPARQQAPRRVSPRSKASAARQPVTQPPRRRRDTHRALEAAIESKQELARTRSKKRRVLEDHSDLSSPPTSPTNRKSTRSTKRLKASASTPSPLSPPTSSPTRAPKDTPNNPFLVKDGEKPRRAGAKRVDEHRKLVYVFRGKRIPYDTTEDLDDAGGSPFGSSCPKLLFPSPPSPAAPRKLKFQDEEEIMGGSSSAGPMSSPSRASQRDRSQLGFQTPKRDKGKHHPDGSHMLPTPQSRPRRAAPHHPPHQSKSNPSSRPALNRPVKSGKTMAKAMR